MPREMPDSTVLERQRRAHISEGDLKDVREMACSLSLLATTCMR